MKNFIKINRALAAEKKFYVVLCASLVCAMNLFAQASDSKEVNCDGSVQITATPKAGFHFVQWNDGDLNATRTIANIKEAKTFTATFAPDETDMGGNVDVEDINGDPLPLPVAHGTTIYLHADVDDCHTFHWSDLDSSDPNYSVNPREFVYEGVAPTFTVVLDIIQYNVTVNADDASHGDVTVTVLP